MSLESISDCYHLVISHINSCFDGGIIEVYHSDLLFTQRIRILEERLI